MVANRREIAGNTELESRFYISSLPASAEYVGLSSRGHWGIENGLHWVKDIVFRDDECHIRRE